MAREYTNVLGNPSLSQMEERFPDKVATDKGFVMQDNGRMEQLEPVKTRKQRSDKGKKRGPYNTKGKTDGN